MAIRSVLIKTALVLGAITISGWIFLQTKPFGKLPGKERTATFKQSPNFRDGSFHNKNHTPDLTVSVGRALWNNVLLKDPRSTPEGPLPVIKSDLHALAGNALVWMGHSSALLQIAGKRILIDPVLSNDAFPVPLINRSYKGTDLYDPEDLPDIDVLLISHDHWDHLDYPTVKALQPRIKFVICGLGTGEHFRHWGYREDQIIEKDWNESVVIDSVLTIHVTPARHNSGRALTLKQALWASYVIQTPGFRVFYSGDTGYDTHFSEIGKTYGPFDLALMECGQYNGDFPYTHMTPEQTMQASLDVKAKKIVPVHWGRFTESNHAWDEPVVKITALGKQFGMPVLTPLIGEVVDLDSMVGFRGWWDGVR